MSTSQTKQNHSDPWDWPNCPNGILFSHWCLSSQSCETTRFQTSGYVTIPSENFSLVGYKKDSIRKGGWLVLIKSQSHSRYPLINFPFLAWLPSSLSFSLHSPYRGQIFFSLVKKKKTESMGGEIICQSLSIMLVQDWNSAFHTCKLGLQPHSWHRVTLGIS